MQQEEHTRTDEAGEPRPQGTPQQQDMKSSGLPPESPEPQHHGAAGIVGIIILVLLIALGGLYFWSMNTEAPVIEEPTPAEQETDPVVEAMMQLEGSNEMDAIERDLYRTDLDAIDADLDQLEMEMEAELQTEVQ